MRKDTHQQMDSLNAIIVFPICNFVRTYPQPHVIISDLFLSDI